MKYGSGTGAEYMNARDDGSLKTRLEQGGMIGCDVVGKGAMLGITHDIEAVRALVGAEVWGGVDIHISTDNVILCGTVENVFTMINALATLIDGGGHAGHWQFPESDRVIHRFLELPAGMPTDGITAAQLPDQAELNACLSNVWHDMFPKTPLQNEIHVDMHVTRILGIPVGTDAGIKGYLEAKLRHYKSVTELLVNIPNVNSADVHAVIARSLTKRYKHIIESVEPRLVTDFARRLDEMTRAMYETMYSKAGEGAILHTERVLSPEAIRTMHLPATDEAGGMGVTSMLQMVNSGVWLVTMRSRADMAKTMRFPNEKLVQAHIAQYLLPQVQLMLNRVHRIASAAHRESIEKDIRKAAAAFMKSRTNPRTIRKRLMTVGAKNEAAQVEAHACAHSDLDLAGDIYAAQAARKQTVNAANVWTNSRSGHETKVSNAAFILQLSTLTGWPIPGAEDLHGTKCTCTGVEKQVDGDHAHICKISGRISVHNAVRDGFARLIQEHGGAAARWHRTEVRGDNYYYPRATNADRTLAPP